MHTLKHTHTSTHTHIHNYPHSNNQKDGRDIGKKADTSKECHSNISDLDFIFISI